VGVEKHFHGYFMCSLFNHSIPDRHERDNKISHALDRIDLDMHVPGAVLEVIID
jgi:hypothetical protein